MALTDRQKQTILAGLRGKIRGNCPMCAQSSWNLEEEIVATTTTSLEGGMAIGGPYVPMVQMICSNCGFVAHHAVGALGISLES